MAKTGWRQIVKKFKCFGPLFESDTEGAVSADDRKDGPGRSNSQAEDGAKGARKDVFSISETQRIKIKLRTGFTGLGAATPLAEHKIATEKSLQLHDPDSALPSSSLRKSARQVADCASRHAAISCQLPSRSASLIIARPRSCQTEQQAETSSQRLCLDEVFPVADSLLAMRSQVCGLRLLGRGGQALVLRGVWQLADVAVKLVVANPASTPAPSLARLLLEGPLSKRLRAPNVVETFCYSVTRLDAEQMRACQAADEEHEHELMDERSCGWGCGFGSSSTSSSRTPVSGIIIGEADEEKLLDFLTEQQQPKHQHQVQIQRHHSSQQQQQPRRARQQRWPEERGRLEVEDSAAALVGPLRTFESFDGFGPSPSGRRSAASPAALSYSEALSAAGAAPGCFLTQIVIELCDQGSLADAVAKGAFAKAAHDRSALFAYLRTLYDIAAGMSYLHSNGVIHGDLKPGNVLLRSSRADPRGYLAKVSDFGLSRCTLVPTANALNSSASQPVDTDADGAVTSDADWSSHPYMSPEHFDGRLVMASDVWAFAATAHHMWTGRLPHAGLHPLQVCAGVCDGSLRLEPPPDMPRQLGALLRACMANESARRPAFPRIRAALRSLEAELCGVCE